jgi:serine/threonine protein kinase
MPVEEKKKTRCNKNTVDNIRENLEMTERVDKILICNNRYTIYKNKVLGEGSFGKVYLGKLNGVNDYLAVKAEKPEHNYLCKEASICKYLTDKKDAPIGFSKYHWYGEDDEKTKYLVCEALGKSLQNLQEKCGGSFGLKTILMIAFQLLNRIEYLHNNNFIHRDLKPSNFLIGLGKNQNTIYLVDFGLSKEYTQKDGTHIEYLKNRSYVGTIRYMSINSHKGVETSRRDDMYSFIYMLFFMYYGNLPWQGINDDDKKKRLKIIAGIKTEFNKDPTKFFSNPKVPNAFLNILDYIRKMKFKQNVDYDRVREYLVQEMIHHKFNYDYKWDWI